MQPSDLPKLSAKIHKERERSGLTVRQLAETSGIAATTLFRLESGQVASPKPDHLQRIARALQIDVEDLYAEAGFSMSTELPEMAVYLRRKFGLNDDEVSRIEGYVQAVTEDNQPKEGSDDHKRDQAP